jgi:hypothetical protein
MTNLNNSRISRRSMLRTSGALVAGSAVIAACGGSTETGIARIGETPTIATLPEVKLDDVVLLRTAMSVEQLIIDMLNDKNVKGIATNKDQALIAGYVEAHTSNLSALAASIQKKNGKASNEPNDKLKRAFGDTALELMGEGKKSTDVMPLTHALESLLAATYQYFVSLTADSALRAEMMSYGAQASRRAAVAAQQVSNGIKAFDFQYDKNGVQVVGSIPTFPSAFGALNAVQVALGPDVEDAPRAIVVMDTPSLNSMSYPSTQE